MGDCVSAELDRLHELDRQIADRRELVIQQKRLIADLQKEGRNAIGSMGLLRELEHSLHVMSDHRKVIARRLKRQDHG
jgi:hypothetical protein